MDLVLEISKDNTSLAKLTEQCAALDLARASRSRLPNFDRVQAYASSIFSTLEKGLRGNCKASHRASLYMINMGNETGSTRIPSSINDDNATFRVVLRHNFTLQQQSTPQWMIEEAEVKMMDSIATTIQQPPSLATLPGQRDKGKKITRFQEPKEPSPAVQNSSIQQQQNVEEIIDLCASIQRFRAVQCGICLGYMLDAQNARRHGLYWPSNRLVDTTSFDSLSLGEILAEQGKRQDLRLSIADSRRLAPMLALGILQLHDTPWLGEQLTRNNITLFTRSGKVLAHHPFVSADLQDKVPTQITGQLKPGSCAVVRNEILFALGVVLIELCFRQPFEDFRAPEDLNPDGTRHAASDFLTATRLLDEVYETAGIRYGDAVRRCILCEFDQRKTSLKDDTFRRAVYVNVVTVLEEEVRQFFNL